MMCAFLYHCGDSCIFYGLILFYFIFLWVVGGGWVAKYS